MRSTTALLALACGALTLGCDAEAPTTASAPDPDASRIGETGPETAELQQALADLRKLTAPFHDLEKAKAAGYTVNIGCIDGRAVGDASLGGMGFHYTRDRDADGEPELLVDGEVDLLEPEFLVYMHDRSGKLRFGALDYFVPADTWDVEERGGPPSLLGRDFHFEEAFDGWAMHIWLWWHNPAGILANFNPAVPLCS